MVPPNTVTTDSYAGPRKCESGDTGTCMTVDDYSKFYDFLHAGVRYVTKKKRKKERNVKRAFTRLEDLIVIEIAMSRQPSTTRTLDSH